MSVVRTHRNARPETGEKIVLGRGDDAMWTAIQREWAGTDARRWKLLAILHLYVHCHWTTQMLGQTFGHSRGHISRLMAEAKSELREHFVVDTAPERQRFEAVASGRSTGRPRSRPR